MKNYQNYVDPSLWENGINAAMLSYNLNVTVKVQAEQMTVSTRHSTVG